MQSILATFQNGVLRPHEPLSIVEGEQVKIWLEPIGKDAEELSEEDRDFFRALAERRSPVFQRLTPL